MFQSYSVTSSIEQFWKILKSTAYIFRSNMVQNLGLCVLEKLCVCVFCICMYNFLILNFNCEFTKLVTGSMILLSYQPVVESSIGKTVTFQPRNRHGKFDNQESEYKGDCSNQCLLLILHLFPHLLAVWLCTHYLATLCLSFPISKMVIRNILRNWLI